MKKTFFSLALLLCQASFAMTLECTWRGNRYDAISQTRGLGTCFQEILQGKVCFTGRAEDVYLFLAEEAQPRAYELSRMGELMYYALITDVTLNAEAQTVRYQVDQAGYQRDLTIGRCQ